MPACMRCQKDVGFLGSLAFNRQTNRCGKCENEVKLGLGRFRQGFLSYCADGFLTEQEWGYLQAGLVKEQLDPSEALAFIRGDALHFLDRTLAFAASDGLVTEQEEHAIRHLQQLLAIPQALAQPILDRLDFLRQIRFIRQGRLPTVTPSVRLDSSELCHLETPATYHRVNAKSVTQVHGRLLATNKKLHFLSPTGGMELTWKTVMRVEFQPGGIYLELSRKSGNGYYAVPFPIMAEAIIDTILRVDRREILAPSSATESRHIPHEVRTTVWQRDQGKCVQCGNTGPGAWLEFDHIIPHSLGGANTVGNVQLLCRGCNLAKSNRI